MALKILLVISMLSLACEANENRTYFQSMWSWGTSLFSQSDASSQTTSSNSTWTQTVWSWGSTIGDYWQKGTHFARQIGLTEGCEQVTCNPGHVLLRNRTSPKVIGDGCGSFGWSLPDQIMIGFTVCCDMHDLCYSKCGSRRSRCDSIMRSCHMDVCQMVVNLLGNDSSIVSVCLRTVDILYETVNQFGCVAFRAAQDEQCYCHQIRTR